MRKFLPKIGFLFEKLDFRQLKNRNKRFLGGALLSTEHVIRTVKEFQDCVARCVLVFLSSLDSVHTACYVGILVYCRHRFNKCNP